MADITNEIEKIGEAVYGEEVRGAIMDALEAMNEQAAAAQEWATGEDDPTAEPGPENNAKYWAGQAAAQAEAAAGSAASGIAALANEAPTFDVTKAYTAGEYVLYDSVLYRFTADHSDGAWTGADATAVKIGGEIADARSALVGVSDRTDVITGAVNYNYDQFADLPENPTSSYIKEHYGVKRELTQVTINASVPRNYNIRVRLSGAIDMALNTAEAKEWTQGITLKNGHTYQLITRLISGTVTPPDGINPPVATVYKVGTTTAEGNTERDGFDAVLTFTAPVEAVNVVLSIQPNIVMLDAVYQVILRDTIDIFSDDEKIKLKEITAWNPLQLSYGRGEQIVASEAAPADLDDFVIVGNYYIITQSTANYVANLPVNNAGRLIVMSINMPHKLMQVYIPTVAAQYRIYTRSKNDVSAEWSPWIRVLTDNMIDGTPTAGSTHLVTSGGIHDAIANAVSDIAVSLVPRVQPSSAGKIYFPASLHSQELLTYTYDADGTARKITQGICSDGKRHLYFPFKVAAGEPGDDEQPVMCKWDATTNSPVLFLKADKSYGHIEDMCFVPAYVSGFDDGNVDRLYLTDMNRSSQAGETGTIHVISADDLSFIKSFVTYDAEDDTKNLISKSITPYWHGAYHLGYSPERELFFVHSAFTAEDGTRPQTLAVFNADGTLVKGLNYNRSKGTYTGFDCDENFIYTTIYTTTGTEDVFDIWFYVFDWELNPIGISRIDQKAWEIEGVCHIGTEFFISWIKKAGSARDGIYITKTSYIKNQAYDTDTTFPVAWNDSLFNRASFSYFTGA